MSKENKKTRKMHTGAYKHAFIQKKTKNKLKIKNNQKNYYFLINYFLTAHSFLLSNFHQLKQQQ